MTLQRREGEVAAPVLEPQTLPYRGAASDQGRRIPKRIIQIGRDKDFSVKQRAIMSNMKLLNPDYEYLYFDNKEKDNFVREEFPEYCKVYQGFQYPIQKYDFFRYLAVYRYGGFYFDMDVLLAANLTPLLEHSCVFPFETISTSHYLRDDLGMDWQIGNYAFGAAPQHPFLNAIIRNCVRGQREQGWVKPMMRGTPPFRSGEFLVINTTGPGLVSRTFAENPEIAKDVAILLPDDVCDRRNWDSFGEWGTHLPDASWREKRNYVHEKVSGHLWRWIERRRIHASRKLGKGRSVEHAITVGSLTKSPARNCASSRSSESS